MTHPRRKLTPHVQQIRADYAMRRNAEQMVLLGRAILGTVPTCMDHARRLGVTQNIVLSAARGLTYKEVS